MPVLYFQAFRPAVHILLYLGRRKAGYFWLQRQVISTFYTQFLKAILISFGDAYLCPYGKIKR